jgi:thiol-disulfide isomerase/thioredoxin
LTTTLLCLCLLTASPLELVKAKCMAAIAITAASAQPDDGQPRPDVPKPDDVAPPDNKPHDATCKCGGTGKLRTGDGLSEFPCPCDARCKCKRRGAAAAEAQRGKPRQVVVLTASWCLPCQPVKETVKKLKDAGWDVSDTDTAQIRLVDPEMQPALAQSLGVEAVPTVLVLQDGKVVSRLTGLAASSLTTFAIGDMYTGKVTPTTAPPDVQPQQTWTYQFPTKSQRQQRVR